MDQLSLFDLTPEASCVWAYSPLTALTEPLTEAYTPSGQEYCHWLAGGRLFHGIFVGEENT